MTAVTLDTLRDLLALIEGTPVTEVELETDTGRIRVRVQAPGAGASLTGPAAPSSGVHEVPAVIDASTEGQGLHTIISPFVGVFYRAPKPGEPTFVEKGDLVEEGQVLCIVEAMKLMNEIQADRAGRIVDILLEDGQNVEYGEPLFLIGPA